MELKTSQIVSCEFTNEFKPPKTNNVVYYHRLELANGDIGTIGTLEKMPDRLAVGTVINYDYDSVNRKIKLEQSMSDFAASSSGTKKPFKQGGGARVKNQDEFLGYSWGYAKDLIIAGKTMKDVEELNKVARYIYSEIGKMLRNE
jgi:hypothetical protein